jgi:hypothetical protein
MGRLAIQALSTSPQAVWGVKGLYITDFCPMSQIGANQIVAFIGRCPMLVSYALSGLALALKGQITYRVGHRPTF